MCTKAFVSAARGNEYSHAEHRVLAYWLGQQTEPVPADVDEACRELGFGEPPLALYTSADAAVADILLDNVAHDLFWSWAIERSQQNVMRELFKIDWASCSDVYNWPVIYQVIWVPFFARYLVVASAAWPDAHARPHDRNAALSTWAMPYPVCHWLSACVPTATIILSEARNCAASTSASRCRRVNRNSLA